MRHHSSSPMTRDLCERNGFKRSSRGVLLALISAAFAQSALANSGRVDFTMGSVTVTNGGGKVSPLAKGEEVRSGDKIVSGSDGRAQIRFSDGAYVSVQPNSEFDIKEYRFDGKTDGSESAVFALFKGALRTVTGLVGRVNRSKYQITTPTATIGIRGTGGVITVSNDGSTLVRGTSGVWTLSNNGGTLEIPAGTSGFAGANQNVPPAKTSDNPTVPPPEPVAPQLPVTVVQGEERTATGANAVFTTVLPNGPGYAIGNVSSLVGQVDPNTIIPADATFDNKGLTQFTFNGGARTVVFAGTLMEPGSNGTLAWGRWTGDLIDTSSSGVKTLTFGPNQGFHYVTGIPTAAASLPGTGIFTYDLLPGGATSPTFANGADAPGVLNTASLTGNFLSGDLSAHLVAAGAGLTFDGIAVNAKSTIGLPFSLSGTYTTSGCGLRTGCQLSVEGFFAGADAAFAGITYNFANTAQGSDLSGAAALGRTALVPSLLVSGAGFAAATVFDVCGDACNNADVSSTTTAVFDGAGQMTQFDLTGDATPTFNGTYALGANGANADFGTDGILAWGRWTGDITKDGAPFITYPDDSGLHYVTGTPTPVSSLPGTNSFTYNLIGATRPTYATTTGGIAQPGTLNSATLTGNFSSASVAVSLGAVDGNGATFNVAGATGSMNKATDGAPFTATGGTVSGTGCCVCSFNVSGFFAGVGATHAGISYVFSPSNAGPAFTGAAALKR
jgi:hypothetical protein